MALPSSDDQTATSARTALTASGVRESRFERRWGGYDVAVVDDLLDFVADSMERGRPARHLALGMTLPTRLRGYDRAAVDALFARLRQS